MGGDSGRKKTPSAKDAAGNVPYFKKLAKSLRLEATAHHEAGHAVAALHHELKFTYVTIIPDEKEGSLGHIRYRGLSKKLVEGLEFGLQTPRQCELIESHVINSFVGGEAEARFRDNRHNYDGAKSDRQGAIELASSSHSSGGLNFYP
jgi:ATP-dependent Zn protease